MVVVVMLLAKFDTMSCYMLVLRMTCVMSIPGKTFRTKYILATNKTVKQ